MNFKSMMNSVAIIRPISGLICFSSLPGR